MTTDTVSPIVVDDTVSLSVGAASQATGNVLTNDSDPDGDTLSVATVNSQASNVGANLVGSYGTLLLKSDGTYTYLVNSQAVASLTPGQTVHDTFHYTVTDGNDHTVSTSTVSNQNLITWSEAFDNSAWVKYAFSGSAPTITANAGAGPTGTGTTADQVTLAGANRGLFFNTPIAGQVTFSVWVKLVSGDGHFDLSYWDGNGANTASFLATSSWQRFTYTFTGNNLSSNNVAFIHDATQTGTGTFQIWGAQLNLGATATDYLPTTGSIGTATTTTTSTPEFGADLTVNITAPSGAVDAAPSANADSGSVKVAVTTQATGNVLTNDTDPEHDPLSVATVNGQAAGVGSTIAGTYGTLVLGANGQYTYTLSNNAAVSGLAPGQAAQDVFHYTITDGHSHPVTTTVSTQNLITWSEAFDNAAWVKFAFSGSNPSLTANVGPGPLGGASTADQLTLAQANSGLFFQTSAAGQYTFSVWVKLVSGDGHLDLNYYNGSSSVSNTVVATSSWQRVSFTFNGTGSPYANVGLIHGATESTTGVFQFWGAQLNSGATPTDYVATSGAAASGTTTVTAEQVIGADLTINVAGPPATGIPPVAVADAGVAPGAAALTGNVLTNDQSPAGFPLSVSAVNGQAASVGATIAGTYGTLHLNADGSYTYQEAVNQANVMALAPGQTVRDIFQYTVSDGHSYTQTTSGISGANSILYSEAFDNSKWSKFALSGANPTVTANVAAGPLGGAATADQLVLPGANSGIYYGGGINGQATFSVWVKLVSGDGHFDLNYFDGSASHATSFVATNTWQRFSITFNGNYNASDNVAIMHDATQSASGTFQIFGAQVNPGATPGDYAATNGHYETVFANTSAPAVVTANLAVTVSGADPASVTPGALTFAGGNQGMVVNLAAGSWARATTVLPLGDSITYGWTATDYAQGQTNLDDGYRGPLWWDYAFNGTMINFVGPNTSGDSLLPDQSHAGTAGQRSDGSLAALPGLLSTQHPDAILLMTGTNDIFQETQPAAHIADSITRMLKLVNATSPDTMVYVATLTPINPVYDGETGDDTAIPLVNAAIKQAVSQAQAQGIHVTLVDTSSMTLSDIADAAHPTTAGYSKLANIWYNAMLSAQPNVGGTPSGEPHTIGSGINTVVGSEDGDLIVANSAADTLSGGGGADRLVTGIGQDRLSGGTGADMFVFKATSGAATITDFSQTQGDHIELDNFGLTQFSQLSSHITRSGSSTLIDLTSFGGHTVTLQNFSGTLTSNDFFLFN
jgi:VCBS repeat-containing protein